MNSDSIGQQYDKIASWWNDRHIESRYGVPQVERALKFVQRTDVALDVGCGSGGRLVRCLKSRGFHVIGVDASAEMIALAQANHPDEVFVQADIRHWDTGEKFDFILAWDCLFHLPLHSQEPVLARLCKMLTDGGILIHTFGDGIGAHKDEWLGQVFSYSSVGIARNIDILRENNMSLLHLELDQFPERHVYAVSRKDIP